MSILDTLITDRTQADVNRIKNIMQKGLPRMTADEYQYFIRGSLETLNDSVTDALVDADGLTLQCRDGVLPKGSYNYTDLNRVMDAVEYLTGVIRSAGYEIDDPTPIYKTHTRAVISQNPWNTEVKEVTENRYIVSDIPTPSEMEIYLSNVQRVISRLPLVNVRYDTIPTLPDDMDGLLPAEANDIEKVLPLIADTIERLLTERLAFYSGELYGGEI